MSCAIRVAMNEFLVQKLTKSKQDNIYSPLTDHMEVMECTPVKIPSSVGKPKVLTLGRRLFAKNKKSFKVQEKKSPSKSRLGRFRTLFQTLQNKLHAWSEEMRANTHENKTPNFTTPNRRVRHMLGRTPEQLYSPFCIETPPSHLKKRTRSINEIVEYPMSAFHDWISPPKRKPARNKSKIVTNLF